MCKWLLDLITKKPVVVPPVLPPVVVPPIIPTLLPHPGNSPNSPFDDRKETIEKILVEWNIPPEWHTWWRNIPTELVIGYQYPASWQDADGNPNTNSDQVVKFHELWDTPGACIHEFGHVDWEFLEPFEKQEFETLHNYYKDIDPYLVLLYSINRYGLTNANEAHSEWLRYIGIDHMPEVVRKYYTIRLGGTHE